MTFCSIIAALFVVLTLTRIPFAQTQSEWENPVKKLLKEGKPVIGATLTVPSPEIAAQIANMGFDFLWIEMEHSRKAAQHSARTAGGNAGAGSAIHETRLPLLPSRERARNDQRWSKLAAQASGQVGL